MSTSNWPRSTRATRAPFPPRKPPPTASSSRSSKLDHAKRGFVLLPRRWVVERSFGWAARFRRLARDYERLAASLAGLHWLAFVCLMLKNLFT